MFDRLAFVHSALFVMITVIAVLMILCLIRAIKGPRYTDRIVACNMINTLTIIMIILLSFYLDEEYLLDVAIIYALIGFLSVVVITRVATYRHYGTLMHKEDVIDAD